MVVAERCLRENVRHGSFLESAYLRCAPEVGGNGGKRGRNVRERVQRAHGGDNGPFCNIRHARYARLRASAHSRCPRDRIKSSLKK